MRELPDEDANPDGTAHYDRDTLFHADLYSSADRDAGSGPHRYPDANHDAHLRAAVPDLHSPADVYAIPDSYGSADRYAYSYADADNRAAFV
jgi:hypothetical protein